MISGKTASVGVWFATGRDEPVPYNARTGTVHEFDTGRDKPVPYMRSRNSRSTRLNTSGFSK